MADPSAQEQQPPAEAAEAPEVAAKPQDGPQGPALAEQQPEPQQEQQQDAAAAPAAEGAATHAAAEEPAPQQQEQQQEKTSEPEPAYPQPPPEGAAQNGATGAAAAAAGAPKRTAEQAGLGGGADEDARPSKSLRLDGGLLLEGAKRFRVAAAACGCPWALMRPVGGPPLHRLRGPSRPRRAPLRAAAHSMLPAPPLLHPRCPACTRPAACDGTPCGPVFEARGARTASQEITPTSPLVTKSSPEMVQALIQQCVPSSQPWWMAAW
jgi:hypothetical protein